MTIPLVTLQQAKDQVEASGFTDDDSRILLRVEEASDIILGYLKLSTCPWTDRTVPPRIRSAVLLVLSWLYTNRGDDSAAGSPISQAVIDLLFRDRDPALA